MCRSEGNGYRVVRTWVVPAWAIAQVRLSPGRLAAVAGDFDRSSETLEDWMIAVWLSAREEGFHDTTVAEPVAPVALVAH
jgi:transposase-like protein